MRYFLHIGYNGSNYSGWQFQPGITTIQGTIEDILERMFKTKITIFGCGRTDSGVHASQYMMHIDLPEPLTFDLKFRLNKNLPEDIAIFDVLEMENHQHVRYDAISRTYDYFLHLDKDPALSNYSSYYELENLDFESMKKAAAILPLYEDFKAVCRRPHLYKHTRCNVSESKIFVDDTQRRLRFTITSNRFLQGMIRYCVHFFLQIGKGEMSFEEFEYLVANQIELAQKRFAYPNGLYLSKIVYPYLNMDTRPDICRFLKMGLGE